VYTPALPVQESKEVPEPETLVGVRVHVKPVLGETVVVRLTTPVKACNAVIVIVEVPEVPVLAGTPVGVASRVKSCTVKVTVAE
jgi:hypothetical protein